MDNYEMCEYCESNMMLVTIQLKRPLLLVLKI